MGWTWTQRSKGETHEEFFIRTGVLRWNVPDVTYRVLKSATIGGVFYGAIERCKDNERRVFAVIILTQWDPHAKSGNNFGYKDLDETDGPYQAQCPDAILDLLTETNSKYANDWRATCREYNRKKQESKQLMKVGQTLHVDVAILSGGKRITDFTIVGSDTKFFTIESHGPELIEQQFRVSKTLLTRFLTRIAA